MKNFFINLLLLFSFQLISCSDENITPEVLFIGDYYEGGIIFYLDTSGKHGLICAIEDQSASASWCSSTDEVSGADGTAIGTGAQNTIDILAACPDAGSAADLCASLTLNGKSDWFLPSKETLVEMDNQRIIIDAAAVANGGGALADATYWSSSELNLGGNTSAITYSFEFNVSGSLTKFGTARVRAVRAF